MKEEEMLTEVWKDIEGYSGYQVSNLGRVKSLVKLGRRKERILKGSPNTTGYMLVQLYSGDGLKSRKSLLVHRLVMLTFQPNEVMDELDVNHKDLDVKNNKMSNLEWVTRKENMDHYWTNPNIADRLPTPFGEQHHLSNLTESQVLEIREVYNSKQYTTIKSLLGVYGISRSTFESIVKGRTWKHLL